MQIIYELFISEIKYYFNIEEDIVKDDCNYILYVKDYMLSRPRRKWEGIPFEENYTERLDELELISVSVGLWSVDV